MSESNFTTGLAAEKLHAVTTHIASFVLNLKNMNVTSGKKYVPSTSSGYMQAYSEMTGKKPEFTYEEKGPVLASQDPELLKQFYNDIGKAVFTGAPLTQASIAAAFSRVVKKYQDNESGLLNPELGGDSAASMETIERFARALHSDLQRNGASAAINTLLAANDNTALDGALEAGWEAAVKPKTLHR